MTPSGGWTSLMVILAPILMVAVFAFALMRNRKLPKSDLERTERATHDRIKEQDAIDKARGGQDHLSGGGGTAT